MTASAFPKSPVTGTGTVREYDRIEVSDIVRLYRDQTGVDVSRFFEGLEHVSILECESTGYRFYFPFTVAGDEAFYQELAASSRGAGSDYDRDWSEDHEIAKQYISSTDKVLEIGCNTGKFLEKISEITKDVVGLEFNDVAARQAKQKGLNVSQESIENYAQKFPESVDVVCAFQVFEHVPDPGNFISSALRVLRPGGRLIISVPNSDPYYQRFSKYETLNLPPHHLGLWNEVSLSELPEFFAMELVSTAYFGALSLRGELYSRSRYRAGVKSELGHHSALEKLRLVFASPFVVPAIGSDLLFKKKSYAYISIVFKKR